MKVYLVMVDGRTMAGDDFAQALAAYDSKEAADKHAALAQEEADRLYKIHKDWEKQEHEARKAGQRNGNPDEWPKDPTPESRYDWNWCGNRLYYEVVEHDLLKDPGEFSPRATGAR